MIHAQNFTVVAGSHGFRIAFTVTTTSAAPKTLTGCQATWKLRVGSPNGTALVTKTHASGISLASNVATVQLDSADTLTLDGVYYHDIKVTDADGVIVFIADGVATILAKS